jgi:hypothetical protein
MRIFRSRRLLVATAVAAAVVAGTSFAVADTILNQTVLADTSAVHFKVIRTSAVGFDSGWHVHTGPAIVQVQRGHFRIWQGRCHEPRRVGPGQTFIEVPDIPVRAVAHGRIDWTTTIIYPEGTDALTPVPDPCAN